MKLIHTILILTLGLAGVACDESGPAALDTELTALFRGVFTPIAVSTTGTCSLELESIAVGGEMPYLCHWSMSWINQSRSARGYPSECQVNISLAETFGAGGLFPIELTVTDQRNKIDTAGTDQTFDCAGDAVVTFFGS